MPHPPILYCGDTSLTGAASYLAGLITHWGHAFDYVPSDEQVPTRLLDVPRQLFVLSDYPAAMLNEAAQHQLVAQVQQGAGLVMIGGWESFCGQGGDWADTPVAQALPVNIASSDDRVNCDQPALVVKRQDHPIVDGLPWQTRPPTIGGFNKITPKADAQVILEVQRFAAHSQDNTFRFEPAQRDPLLVVGSHSQGRTAALATDIAPHWVGGLVDWGDDRVVAQAKGSEQIEVGDLYAKLVGNLLAWTGRLNDKQSQVH